MKNLIVCGLAVMLLASTSSAAYLWYENFEDGTADWGRWQQRGTLNATTTATEDPDLGDPATTLDDPNNTMAWVHGSNFNGGLYKVVTGLPVAPFPLTIDGYWRAAGSIGSSSWAEVIVMEGNVVLNNANDYGSPLKYKDDDFGGTDPWNGQISATSDQAGGATGGAFTTASGTVTILLKAGSNTSSDRGTYFDDMYITPEPAAIALLGLGAIPMFRRRRA